MLGPTDGNLYALAQYQRRADEDEAYADAFDSVLEDHPDWSEDDVNTYLQDQREEAEESRAEALYEAQAAAAEARCGW